MSLLTNSWWYPFSGRIILDGLWWRECGLSESLRGYFVTHNHVINLVFKFRSSVFGVLLNGWDPFVNKIILALCGSLSRGVREVYHLLFSSLSLKWHVNFLRLIMIWWLRYQFRFYWSRYSFDRNWMICRQVDLSMNAKRRVTMTIPKICTNLVGRRYIIVFLQMTHKWWPIANEIDLESRLLVLVTVSSPMLSGNHLLLLLRQIIIQV